MPLESLTEFQGNLKHRDMSDYDKIIKSIDKHGFSCPFYVWQKDGKNICLDGHGRIGALKELKKRGVEVPELPVIYLKNIKTEKQAKDFLLRINSNYGKMSKQSVLDFIGADVDLKLEEFELPAFSLNLTSPFEPIDDAYKEAIAKRDYVAPTTRAPDPVIEEKLDGGKEDYFDPNSFTINDYSAPIEQTATVEQEEIEEDEAPEVDTVIHSKLGEVYYLGKHAVMCGDSTNSNHIAKLMGSTKTDAVFTDPPYGMKLDTDYSKMNGAECNNEFRKSKGVSDGKEYKKVIGDNEDFNPALIKTVFNNFGYCKEIFLWGADYFAEHLEKKNEGSWVVWDKRDDNPSFDKMFGSMFELCWSKNKHKREIARVRWCGVFGTETEFDRKRYHPTQKPTKLVRWFIERYTQENNIVVDLYGGSGSTLIGCEQTGRIARVMELDPAYVDVIRKRYTKYCKMNNLPIPKDGLE